MLIVGAFVPELVVPFRRLCVFHQRMAEADDLEVFARTLNLEAQISA